MFVAARKRQEREEARRLRREEGWSFHRIAVELGVSPTSVSSWVRDIELTDEQRAALPGARGPVPVPTIPRGGRPVTVTDDVMRECRHHGLAPHGNYRTGEGRRRLLCKRCAAESVTRRHQKMRRILLDEAGGRCAVCGYDRCRLNLHFHHVDPARKSLSMDMGRGKSLATYREEAKKCVLVCANCHGEIEAGLIASPPPGATFASLSPPESSATPFAYDGAAPVA